MTQPTDFSIQVQSEDPKKKEKPQNKDKLEGSSKSLKGAKKDGEGEEGEELVRRSIYLRSLLTSVQSEEDQQLKNELEMLVERLKVPFPRYILGSSIDMRD